MVPFFEFLASSDGLAGRVRNSCIRLLDTNNNTNNKVHALEAEARQAQKREQLYADQVIGAGALFVASIGGRTCKRVRFLQLALVLYCFEATIQPLLYACRAGYKPPCAAG